MTAGPPAVEPLGRRWWVLPACGAVVLILIGIGMSVYVSNWQAELLLDAARRLDNTKDQITVQRDVLQYLTDSEVKIWTVIVQSIGAGALALGGYFTWRNLRVAQDTLRAIQAKLDVDRQGQFTDRFTKAIDQLGATQEGHPNLEMRLGGIHALERLARDSSEDRLTITEVLTSYVRHYAPASAVEAPSSGTSRDGLDRAQDSPKPRDDVQAVLTVLGRLTMDGEGPSERLRIDLHETDLRGAYLAGCHFEGAVLWGTHFEYADLREAHLEYAVLWDAHFDEADLWRTNLEGAHLCWDPDLSDDLRRSADFRKAINLTHEQVASAHDQGKGNTLLPSEWPL
jgi:hypothetical protein